MYAYRSLKEGYKYLHNVYLTIDQFNIRLKSRWQNLHFRLAKLFTSNQYELIDDALQSVEKLLNVE